MIYKSPQAVRTLNTPLKRCTVLLARGMLRLSGSCDPKGYPRHDPKQAKQHIYLLTSGYCPFVRTGRYEKFWLRKDLNTCITYFSVEKNSSETMSSRSQIVSPASSRSIEFEVRVQRPFIEPDTGKEN